MSAHAYIVTDKPRGVLYTGVTSRSQERVRRHREKFYEGFTKRYGCHTLVRFEQHDSTVCAIQREKSIKRYRRDRKLNLIEALNPHMGLAPRRPAAPSAPQEGT